MYEGRIFRPPSEASSLILQVTVGCAHNACTFCSMYREKQFRIKPLEEVLNVLEMLSAKYAWVERVFIADGDALILPMDYWRALLKQIHRYLPNVKRITAYGTPRDVLGKSVEELTELREMGISMIYMGLESGSDIVLSKINKGVDSDAMIEAGRRLKQSGIKQSITVISGIGGKAFMREHAIETARVLSAMDPEFIGLLTLLLDDESPMLESIKRGEMAVLTPSEVLDETRLLIEGLDLSGCEFRSNHASNYLALSGRLPQEKANLIRSIDNALNGKTGVRSEDLRRL